MFNHNHDPRRSPYYTNTSAREPRARRRGIEKTGGIRISDHVFDVVTRLAERHNLSVSRPDGSLLPSGPHVIIGDKRCRICYITKPLFPRKTKTGFMRGTVVKESLTCTDYHIFICAAGGTPIETYVMPNEDAYEFLFAPPCRGDVNRNKKVLNFPHPSHPASTYQPYLEAWHLLA